MPCYATRTVTQSLSDVNDINLLARGLEEMGFTTRVIGKTVAFSGVDKTTGEYQSGEYRDGKLTSSTGMNLVALGQYVGKANIKKQVSDNNTDKYKATKITLTWTSEFDFVIDKGAK
jgi:hypothetical protein